ncbi:pyruvate dehydrogenase (acetyl-transferring), homodimeric type [Buchnera aphidicola]|uniref:Pyruvate dehydrogenase E1 component n=1 Tax=Buchnera aphidicola (Anoecia oenotherae) TaxID=1241833 RepID=A0A4D6XRA0_9GAMM|nr:pyruvate dehydrogenase (acetyl-transferring), homodimeric type [Buchnera aphidicola]QCI19296.1 pyruvate dehydrogenase (acetyl-transferring), homodimeric type [Buchnera aphidicola (Anoecia oenotherae)]
MSNDIYKDVDPLETKDWMQALQSMIDREGSQRTQFIIKKLIKKAKKNGIKIFKKNFNSDYINSIHYSKEKNYPGNLKLEKNICNVVRWNAIILVLRASKKNLDLGGHLASFQSVATLYEVCFNHFFKADNKKNGGDLIYFQGHISPGIYARAFVENRLSEEKMNNFRQEINGNGLSSYPHPKLMPEFWQFPTVSMGLSPICSIYQARFLKYLKNRKLKDTSQQTVYAFLGDGEMDEPESKGALNIAVREKLDNLIFIINCNLQRLDGPVIGNGKIINELENTFNGSGWKVIKVIWGSRWDSLLDRDKTGKLVELMNETVDGDYQNFKSKNGKYIRKYFFEKYNQTKILVENMTDQEIWNLNRGGHDPVKIFNAIKKAKETKKKPVVILLHTVKGYGMGKSAEAKNTAHQVKSINIEDLLKIKKKLNIPIEDDKIESLPFVRFKKTSEQYKYIIEKRISLGGFVPQRRIKFSDKISIPQIINFKKLLEKQQKKISTTIAFVRILNILLKDKKIKKRIVPIIADEARTFGMEGLFRTIGIYNSEGQIYTPQDKEQLSFYKEEKTGQMLQEGISELGAASSWLAAATSYSSNNYPMIPFFIYYSMFGFQRIGDLFWAAGDQQARGFLIGGTSGRTTLNGEGLQHEDGHSHIYSSTVPNCISYDPAYAYELAIIIQNGIERMYGPKQENIYFYITTSNENIKMPEMKKEIKEGICKGIYKLQTIHGKKNKVQLIGSGSILQNIIKAGEILSKNFNIGSEIYSATSFTELAREGQDCDRWNTLNPKKPQKIPYVTKIMKKIPTIAATDFIKSYPEQIRSYIPTRAYRTLGTDGFGRSDSRENLRSHFEISPFFIVITALNELAKKGKIKNEIVEETIIKFNIDPKKINPRIA